VVFPLEGEKLLAGTAYRHNRGARFHGQTSWQMSQPKTWFPIGSRNSFRDSAPQFDRQGRKYTFCIHDVGLDESLRRQASRQRRQLPHKSGGGSSFAPSAVGDREW